MNAPLDDKALDEYLTRGSEVSRRYRELDDGAAVPPELDRRVLAEARAAASKNQSGGRTWMRWSAPIALAASAVLVVSIVIESGVEQGEPVAVTKPVGGDARTAKETSEAKRAAAPAAAPVEVFTGLVPDATFEPQAPPEAPASASNVRSRDQTLARQSQEQPQLQSMEADREEVQVTAQRRAEVMMDSPAAVAVEQSAPVSPATAPSAVDASALQEAVVTGQRRSEQRRASGPRDTIARSSASGASVSAQQELAERQFKKVDPERWLEEIRQLRRDRKSREADSEWDRFREAFPDYPVAEDDIATKRP